MTSTGAWPGARCWKISYWWPSTTSWRTACRWLKVPRAVSWPANRTMCPSTASDAKASASAADQSSGNSPLAICRLRSILRWSFLWTWNPRGIVAILSSSDCNSAIGTPVSGSSSGSEPPKYASHTGDDFNGCGFVRASFASTNCCSNSSRSVSAMESASTWVILPSSSRCFK